MLLDGVRVGAWSQLSAPPLPGEPPRHGQLETIDRSLGLVSKRGEGLDREDYEACLS